MSTKTIVLAGALACWLAVPSYASTAYRSAAISGANACVANSTTTVLRFAVTGVRNAGTENVYVTCGVNGDADGSDIYHVGTGSTGGAVGFRNTTTAAVVVKCTMYPGSTSSGSVASMSSYPRSATVPADAYRQLSWSAIGLPEIGERFANMNISCSLPPGVILTTIYDTYDQQVGN